MTHSLQSFYQSFELLLRTNLWMTPFQLSRCWVLKGRQDHFLWQLVAGSSDFITKSCPTKRQAIVLYLLPKENDPAAPRHGVEAELKTCSFASVGFASRLVNCKTQSTTYMLCVQRTEAGDLPCTLQLCYVTHV